MTYHCLNVIHTIDSGMLQHWSFWTCQLHLILSTMLKCVSICRCHTVWVALCWSGFSRITMGAQYVRHGTLKSFQTWLICSVPQGSVLGLILFILYTNDLIGLAEQHDFCPHLYADNTQVYGSCRPSAVADFQVRLSAGTLNLREWTMQEWTMRQHVAGVDNAGVDNAGVLKCV